MKTILVISALLTGCVSAGVQVKQEQLAEFKNGITTESEVVQKLGKPTTSMINSDGTKMLGYSFVHAQARASSFIPIVGAFVGGSDSQINSTLFRFDQSGKLISYSSTESQYGSGTGLSAGRPIAQTDQPRQ
jgi:hypothetical protein